MHLRFGHQIFISGQLLVVPTGLEKLDRIELNARSA
jgi:hypothetical protein